MRNPWKRLKTRVIVLAIAAALPFLLALLYAQADEQDEELRRAVEEHRRIVRLAADRASAVIADAERFVVTLSHAELLANVGPAACSTILADMMAARRGLVNIALLESDGRVLCAAATAGGQAFVRSDFHEWFADARAGTGAVISNALLSGTKGEASIVMAAPVERHGVRRGAPDRVFAVLLDLAAVSRSFDDGELPQGGRLVMLDRQHRIVSTFPTEPVDFGIRIPLSPDLLAAFEIAETRELDHPDGPMLVAPVRNDAGAPTGYHVVLAVDGRAAVAHAAERWRSYLLFMGIAIVAAIGLVGFASRWLVIDPMRSLARVTRRIAAGDLGARADLRAGLGRVLTGLGDAINEMAEALEVRERERDLAAMQLRQAKEKYELLFDENPNPMWVYDAGTLRFLAVNQMAIERYGYSREEFLAMSIADIRPAEDVPRVVSAAASRSAGLLTGAGWRHTLRCGEVIDVEVASRTVSFEGRPAVLVCARDISRRLHAEQALAVAEERMRFALEAAGVGVWEANLATRTSHWSETGVAMHAFTGSTPDSIDEFVGHLRPEDRDRARAEIRAALREQRTASIEYRPAAAPERVLRSIGRFFYDADGRAVRGAGVTLDVTDRRQIEERLRHSQKLEGVGQLAGGVAHDFNNLLTVISGNAELALSRPLDDASRSDIGEIVKASTRAAQLTRQLLAFSRKQVLQIAPVNVHRMIESLMPMLRRLIEEDIHLVYDGREPGPSVLADRPELEQAVINLVVNARDAITGGGTIRIEVAEFTRKGRPTVTIAVSDSGAGMPPEVIARAFEPFFTTKPTGKGTGLGLASVYGTVTQSGGEVTIDSTLGKGTRVTMALPAVDPAKPCPNEAPARPAPMPATATVLLVEDQDGVRHFASRVLRAAGYTVIEAASSVEAMRAAHAWRGEIDLIFSDVVMPGPSVVDAIEVIRRARPSMAVLMTSGYPDADVRRRLGDVQLEILPKPFTRAALLHHVAAAIARGSNSSASASEARVAVA